MAITSLKDAFPRMSTIESQGRALKHVAFGMLPLMLGALDPLQSPSSLEDLPLSHDKV